MTDQKMPAWLLEREARATLDSPVLTDAKVQADVQVVLDGVLDALAPQMDLDASMREHDTAARKLTSDQTKLDATIAKSRATVDRDMAAGDVDKAVDERQRLNAAQSIRDDVATALQAERDATAGYSFDAATRSIALLVSEREELNRLLADEGARAEVLALDAKHRQEARDYLTAQALLQLQIAEANSPARMAAIRLEQEREATAARVEQREKDAAGTRPSPIRRPSNAGVAALTALRNRTPVGNPLGVGLANQGW